MPRAVPRPTLAPDAIAVRNARVVENLGLVHDIARRFRGRGLDYEDIVQEGFLGLIRAVELFDESRGNAFSTCATVWIRQAISHAIYASGWPVRLPGHVHTKLAGYRRAERALARSLGRDPLPDEVLDTMGVTTRTRLVFLDALRVTTAGAPLRLTGEVDLAAEDAGGRERDSVERLEWLAAALGRLDGDARRDVALRRGLGGARTTLLKDVGRAIGMSRDAARDRVMRAEARLRSDWKSSC